MFNKITILFFAAFALLSACTASDWENAEGYLTQSELLALVQEKDTSIVIFFTDWCVGKNNIDNAYVKYVNDIQEDNLNAQVILIAADDYITDETLIEHEKKGFIVGRINAGDDAFTNRLRIRKYIKALFPKTKIPDMKYLDYSIPVMLWINKEGELLNAADLACIIHHI